MSYNITRFRIDKIDGLSIPLSALGELPIRTFPDGQGDYYSEVEMDAEVGYIRGDVDWAGRRMGIGAITLYGEWSGNEWPELEKILEQSEGHLLLTLVWEGGDRIENVLVDDGKLAKETI